MASNLFPVSRLFSSSTDTAIQLPKRFINYAVVDAFTDTPFKGNPAAVCLLPVRQDSHWMQQVASEFNLSQTVFLVRTLAAVEEEPCCTEGSEHQTIVIENSGNPVNPIDGDNDFDIRWFTPCSEVDLCGHATLASAYLLFSSSIVSGDLIRFHTRRFGILLARKLERSSEEGDECINRKRVPLEKFMVELSFPALSSTYYDSSGLAVLSETLKGVNVISVRKTANDDLLVELSSEEEVRSIQPQSDEIRKCNARGVIVTGRACEQSGFDFISRFFAPKVGIDEDPVCGQAHCALAPVWAKKLGKEMLTAYQASKRGGTLHLRVDTTDRVYMQGEAVLVMSGILVHKQ